MRLIQLEYIGGWYGYVGWQYAGPGAALVETYQGGNSMAIPKYKGEVRAGAIIRVLVSRAQSRYSSGRAGAGRAEIGLLRVTYVMLNGLRYGYG